MIRRWAIAAGLLAVAACQCSPATSIDCPGCSNPDASLAAIDSGELDAGVADAGEEAGIDAGADAGSDGGEDAGMDGGTDAGIVQACDPVGCRGCCSGQVCVAFADQTSQSCGDSNQSCAACEPGRRCEGGTCVRDVAQPCLIFAPDELDFRTVAVGCANERAVRIYNLCGAPAVISGITPVSGSSFSLVGGPGFPVTIQSGLFPTEFRFRFEPGTPGSFATTAEVDWSLGGGAPMRDPYRLRGDGDDAGVSSDQFVVRTAADVFLVMDESCSMESRQNLFRNNSSAFLSYPSGNATSFHFGFLSGHSPDSETGIFRGGDAGNFMTEYSPATEFLRLVPAGGRKGGSDLSNIYPTLAALTQPKLTGENAGFLRRDALLSALLMTDYFLWEHAPDAIVDVMRATKGYRNVNDVVVSTIGPAVQSSCAASADDGGYAQMAFVTGGLYTDVCAMSVSTLSDYSANLFGGDQRDFRVLGSAAGVPTVFVNGVAIPATTSSGQSVWRWDGGTVSFAPSYQPQPGGTVRIDYPSACVP